MMGNAKPKDKIELSADEIETLIRERKAQLERDQEIEKFNASLERLLKRADKANLELSKCLLSHMVNEPWKRYYFSTKPW